MFDKSYFLELQDWIEGGCKEELTTEEQDYYNALYAIVGIHRKYGKDRAINLLMHEPFSCSRPRARKMYYEAVSLFYLDDDVPNNARRNMIFDNLQKAAQAVLLSANCAKDMEIYGNLQIQAWKVKQLDREDKIKREKPKEKPIKIYTTDSQQIGIPSINRQELAAQIDSIQDISERERDRLKRDAKVVDVDFEEMLDDTEEETQDYR